MGTPDFFSTFVDSCVLVRMKRRGNKELQKEVNFNRKQKWGKNRSGQGG